MAASWLQFCVNLLPFVVVIFYGFHVNEVATAPIILLDLLQILVWFGWCVVVHRMRVREAPDFVHLPRRLPLLHHRVIYFHHASIVSLFMVSAQFCQDLPSFYITYADFLVCQERVRWEEWIDEVVIFVIQPRIRSRNRIEVPHIFGLLRKPRQVFVWATLCCLEWFL